MTPELLESSLSLLRLSEAMHCVRVGGGEPLTVYMYVLAV
jgi:hypothetical protein